MIFHYFSICSVCFFAFVFAVNSALGVNLQSVKTYISTPYSFKMNLRGSKWSLWTDAELKKEFPNAMCGGDKDGVAFIVVPFYFGEERPHVDAIIQALFTRDFGVDYPSGAIEDFTMKEKGDKLIFRFRAKRKTDSFLYRYRCSLLIRGPVAYLITTWRYRGSGLSDRESSQVEKFFLLYPSVEKAAFDRQCTRAMKENQADVFNRIGHYYFNAKSYEIALGNYRKAIAGNTGNIVFFTNSLYCLNALGRCEEALRDIAKAESRYGVSSNLSAWKAHFYNEAGSTDKAIAAYAAAFSDKGFRENSDFSVYVNLLLGSGRMQEAEKALDLYLGDHPSVDMQLLKVEYLYENEQFRKAFDYLEMLGDGRPLNPKIVSKKLKVLREMNKPRLMLDVCETVFAAGLPSLEIYYFKGEAEFMLKDYAQAKKSLEKALEFEPNNASVAGFLLTVSSYLGEGKNSSLKNEITPVPLPDSLRKRINKMAPACSSEYGACYLYTISGIDFKRNERHVKTIRTGVHIHNEAGVALFNTLQLTYNSLSEDAFINKLTVYDETGEVIGEGDPDSFYVMDNGDAPLATYDVTVNAPVPGLRPGCTIEFITTVRKNSASELNFLSRTFSNSRPTMLDAFYLVGDISQVAEISSMIAEPERTGNSIVWAVENSPVYKWENLQPYPEAWLPSLQICDVKNEWSSLCAEYIQKLQPLLQQNERVKVLAKSLTGDAETAGETVLLLTEYVQRNYTYKGIEFGTRGTIPHTVDKILDQRYGDCKDHSLLLYHLLKASGLDASLALVNTSGKVVKNLPSLDQFDHMIVYTPDLKNGTFLDCTIKGFNLLEAPPSGYINSEALVLHAPDFPFVRMQETQPEQNSVSFARDVEVDGFNLRVKEIVRFKGGAAGGMRSWLRSIDEVNHREYMEKYLRNRIPDACVESCKIQNLYDLRSALIIELNFIVQDVVTKFEDFTLIDFPGFWEEIYLKPTYIEKRRSPFQFFDGFRLSGQTDIKLPEMLKLRELPGAKLGNQTPFFDWSTEYALDTKDTVCIRFECDEKAGRHQAKRYPAYYEESMKSIRSSVRKFLLEPRAVNQ